MLHKKERLIVSQLRNFIDSDHEYSIALVAGIRRTGKTTMLKQLQRYYPDAIYIDLSAAENSQEKIEESFLDNPTSLLLLDEISHLKDYEQYAQMIYNLSSGEHNRKYKAIMTGSSAAHVIKLSSTKLGGGRARLFRLPLLTFVEYLYFTNRILSYSDYDHVQAEDFADYLFLDGFESNLSIHFSDNYFRTFYDEVEISNRTSYLSHSITKLEENDLSNMANLLAYRLSEACSYDTTVRPDVGGQEHIHLYNLGVKSRRSGVDLSDAFISESVSEAFKVSASDKGRIIRFLLYAGLANIEHRHIDSTTPGIETGRVLSLLSECSKESELRELFESISICMSSPLFYTRLGADILVRRNVNSGLLRKGMLFGKMLELYIRGGLANWSKKSTILSSHKLSYDELGEIAIWDSTTSLLCEVSSGNKDAHKINVCSYFKDTPFIRICTTRDKEHFNKIYHQIPFAKLCCMSDTGDIFNLEKTTIEK